MYATTLSSKFQMSIPKGIRETLGLRPGQRFSVIAKGSVIELVPIGTIDAARGRLKGANTEGYRDHKDRT
jgi:AbrB family looped-hinge helix DNA binding protein